MKTHYLSRSLNGALLKAPLLTTILKRDLYRTGLKRALLLLPLLAVLAKPQHSRAAITIESFDRQTEVGAFAAGASDPPANVGHTAQSSQAGSFSNSFTVNQSGPSASSSASASQSTQISTAEGKLLISGNGSSSATASDPTGGQVTALGYNNINVVLNLSGQYRFSLDASTAFANGGYAFVMFQGFNPGTTPNYQYGSFSPTSGGTAIGILPAGRYVFDLSSYSSIPGTLNPTPPQSMSSSFGVNL